jgi:catechol 2,3-dioxygenase
VTHPNPAQAASNTTASLHPDTTLGPVTLAVADLDRALNFYAGVLGFRIGERTESAATLAAGDATVLTLQHKPGARPQPARSTGLYHVAILLPTRADLARTIMVIAQRGYPMQGYADHLVSEAFYLADPDGNGLELYRDRPRDEWPYDNGELRMASDPIDMDDFFGTLKGDPTPWDGMPAGTRIGHMHLRVGDVPRAAAFYTDLIGFDFIVNWPSAAFVSAGGYHHHLGMNAWQSMGAGAPPADSVGLVEWTVILADPADRERLISRLDASETVYTRDGDAIRVADPWGTTVRVTLAG